MIKDVIKKLIQKKHGKTIFLSLEKILDQKGCIKVDVIDIGLQSPFNEEECVTIVTKDKDVYYTSNRNILDWAMTVIPMFKSIKDEENFCEFGFAKDNKNTIYAEWLQRE